MKKKTIHGRDVNRRKIEYQRSNVGDEETNKRRSKRKRGKVRKREKERKEEGKTKERGIEMKLTQIEKG